MHRLAQIPPATIRPPPPDLRDTMGTIASHKCFVGSASGFHLLRSELAKTAGLPPLDLMEGHFTEEIARDTLVLEAMVENARALGHDVVRLPVRCESLGFDDLITLLRIRDSDGRIEQRQCEALAARIVTLLPAIAPQRGASPCSGVATTAANGVVDPSLPAWASYQAIRLCAAQFAAGLRHAAVLGEDVTR